MLEYCSRTGNQYIDTFEAGEVFTIECGDCIDPVLGHPSRVISINEIDVLIRIPHNCLEEDLALGKPHSLKSN